MLSGFGARRVDVTEDNKVFSVSTVLFNAGPPPRRTMSVGPGLIGYNDEAFDEYDDDISTRPAIPRMVLYMANTANANRYLRAQRRVSVDSSYRRNPQSYDTDIPIHQRYLHIPSMHRRRPQARYPHLHIHLPPRNVRRLAPLTLQDISRR